MIPENVRKQVFTNLKESYSSVTKEYVDAEITALEQGKKPTNIIGMLSENMLRKAGYLK